MPAETGDRDECFEMDRVGPRGNHHVRGRNRPRGGLRQQGGESREAGFASLTNRLFLDEGIFNLLCKKQDVAYPFLSLGYGDAIFPFVVFTPEAGCQGCAQGVAGGFRKAGKDIKYRAVYCIDVGCPGIACNSRNGSLVLFKEFSASVTGLKRPRQVSGLTVM